MAIYAGSKSQSLAGKSAYQLAVEDGYTGSEAEFKQLLYNLPSYAALGSAALKDIPASGNASSTQVVLGNDTRLTDSRTAKNIQNTYSATSTDPISGKGVAAALSGFSGGTDV